MGDKDALALIAAGFTVWAATILVVMGLTAKISGWLRLAKAYPCPGGCPQPRYWLGSLIFRGWFGYNNAIIVSADAAALHLTAMPVILAPTHPPVAVPWREVAEVARRRVWFGDLYEVRARRLPELRWGLRPRAWARVEQAAAAAGVRVVDERA